MRPNFILLLVALILLHASPSFPWGSLYPGETHQYIIKTAYDRLKADPAFAPNLFPTFSVIKGHEGVEWTANGLFGVGPDGKGMSAYSDHYYNPVTGEGNGPNAAAKYYAYLVKENVARRVTTEAGGKSAAWSAHYLADMFVPYHVIGTSRRNAERIWNEQSAKHPGTINLGYSVIGSYKLSYATPFKGGDRNFNTELSRFITKTDPAEADWFDAWYYNGNTEAMMINTSSHVAWEAAPNYSALSPGTIIGDYHRRAGQGLPGYAPHWQNAAPTFTNPWDGQARQVRTIAILSATETRKQLESYFDDPTPALAKTIQLVYSMWRSSFSGLRPALAYQPDGPNRYQVTATIANRANAAAQAVQARLTTQDCTVAGETTKTVAGSLPAGGTASSTAWHVKTTGKQCRMNLEVIGSYPIPDLQYASVERSFSPAPPQVEKPKPAPVADAGPQRPAPAALPAEDAWVLVKSEGGADPKFYQETATAHEGGGSYFEELYYDAKLNNRLRYRHALRYTWDVPPRVLKPGSALILKARVEDAGSANITNDFLYMGAGHYVNDDAMKRNSNKERPEFTQNGSEDPLDKGKPFFSTTTWKVPQGYPGATFFISAVGKAPHQRNLAWHWHYAWKEGGASKSNASASSAKKTADPRPQSAATATGSRAATERAPGAQGGAGGGSETSLPPKKTSGTARWYTHATGLYRFRLPDGWKVTEMEEDTDTVTENGTIELYPGRKEVRWDSMVKAESSVARMIRTQLDKNPGSRKSTIRLGSVTADMVAAPQETGGTIWFIYFAHRNTTHFIGAATGARYNKMELPPPVAQMLDALEFLR
jgi:hypothetical protein